MYGFAINESIAVNIFCTKFWTIHLTHNESNSPSRQLVCRFINYLQNLQNANGES